MSYFGPSDDQAGVAPWPTTMQWQRYPDETTWKLEIDTQQALSPLDADYRTVTITATGDPSRTSGLDVVNGSDVAFKELNLRPSTTYFWRVSANLPGADTLGCVRPTQSFTTSDHLPQLQVPLPAEGPINPWGLGFRWIQN